MSDQKISVTGCREIFLPQLLRVGESITITNNGPYTVIIRSSESLKKKEWKELDASDWNDFNPLQGYPFEIAAWVSKKLKEKNHDQ